MQKHIDKLTERFGQTAVVLGLMLACVTSPAWLYSYETPSEKPIAHWAFNDKSAHNVRDAISGTEDVLEGNFRYVTGISGSALKFDGYATVVRREAEAMPSFTEAFSVEAWIAIAAYPWNWCAVVSQEKDKDAGYVFEIGPKGELRLRVYANGQSHECVYNERLPWKQWVHIAGSFHGEHGLTVYVNGQKVAESPGPGFLPANWKSDLLIGTKPEPSKPAYVHRDYGTLPAWFSLDAILDEVKVFDRAWDQKEAQSRYQAYLPLSSEPEIPPRIMPSGPRGPGHFGAYYTQLKYYWEWDDHWRVADHPDVVIQFEGSPVRVVFWRGSRYSPAWVTENNLWMADQSVEAWDGVEGCFEHMQDPKCLYSHVRVLENTPARIVVHWRYAPVSAYNHLWRIDERTGWACWVDEYYYFFPDQTGIRKITWQQGSLGRPRQFQESLPFTHPGQLTGDVIHEDYVTVANLKGETQIFSYVKEPEKKTSKPIPQDLTVQTHNLRSFNKPFIIFEKGNEMRYLRDRRIEELSHAGLSHWPEGQVPCDGRVNDFPDRATHFLSFPVSVPPIHEAPNSRYWIASLYGMTDKPLDDILFLAKSWSQAPDLKLESSGFESLGFDISQRSFILANLQPGHTPDLECVIAATPESPVANACLYIRGWGDGKAAVSLNGSTLQTGPALQLGKIRTLDGNTDLVVWIAHRSIKPLRLRVSSSEADSMSTENSGFL